MKFPIPLMPIQLEKSWVSIPNSLYEPKVVQCKGSYRNIITNPAKFYFLFSSGVILFQWHYKLDFSFYRIYGTIFNQFDFPIYGFVNCVNFLGHISFSKPILSPAPTLHPLLLRTAVTAQWPHEHPWEREVVGR